MKLKCLAWLFSLFSSLQTYASTPWLEHTLPESSNRHYGQHYWVALPEGYSKEPNKAWPVIVFLHGRGEWGDDFSLVTKRGLAQYINEGNKLGAIVIVPQSPQNQFWHPLFVNAVMEDAAKTYRFDPTRIYLTGLSMGGMGSWNMALAYPHRFAALAPIAGSFLNDAAADSLGNDLAPAELLLPILQRIKHLPTWVFHGDRDSLVPTELGQRSEALLKQAGGSTKITIYPMTDHDSWSQTYFENPDFYYWLFAQTNPNPVWEETRPSIDPNRYVGVYIDANGTIAGEIKSLSNGRISLTMRNDNQESQLLAIDAHHFIGTGFVFFEGDGQHMKTLVLPGIGTWSFQP